MKRKCVYCGKIFSLEEGLDENFCSKGCRRKMMNSINRSTEGDKEVLKRAFLGGEKSKND